MSVDPPMMRSTLSAKIKFVSGEIRKFRADLVHV